LRIMVQMIAHPPTDAASTMMIVRVVWDRLEPPIAVLSLAAEEEGEAEM
jgi:hypothetical protein